MRRSFRHLVPLGRSLTTAVAPVAAGAVAATSRVAPQAAGASRVGVPLTQPLPGVLSSTSFSSPLDAPPTDVTVLPNGLRVVTEASTVRMCQ